ncbi:MAG: hypothetical protein AB1589_08625 [Cyanobacteriota bacterium]
MLYSSFPIPVVGWSLQSQNTWLSAVQLTLPTLLVVVDRSPFFHYDYSSSSQRLGLEFLVELLKFLLLSQRGLQQSDRISSTIPTPHP